MKLQKEEEKANKRIREAERKSSFVAEMHNIKANKMAAQNNLRAEMNAKEEHNR